MQYQLNVKHHTSIVHLTDSTWAQVNLNNRHYLKTLVQVILLCDHQENTLRRQRESSGAINRGNFLEILNLVAAHDPIVQQRLQEGPRNAVYTSAEIQDILLHIMGEMAREKICTR